MRFYSNPISFKMVIVKCRLQKGPPGAQTGTIKLGPLKMRFEKTKLFFQTLVFFDINSKKKLASPRAFLGYLTKYLPPRRDFFRIDVFLFESYFFQEQFDLTKRTRARAEKATGRALTHSDLLDPFKMRFEKTKLFFQTLVFFGINSKKKWLPQKLFLVI